MYIVPKLRVDADPNLNASRFYRINKICRDPLGRGVFLLIPTPIPIIPTSAIFQEDLGQLSVRCKCGQLCK